MVMHYFGGLRRMAGSLWKVTVFVAVALVLFVLILNGIRNPMHGQADNYSADFTDASGLHPNADVRVRGVKVGKVTSVALVQSNGKAVARVGFTVVDSYRLTSSSRPAVKYGNLSGVRYLDVSNADGTGTIVRHFNASQTVPSFDITQLFNGLQPVLQTLSPGEINTFTKNAVSLLQGDGSGLGPMLDSVDTLSRYAKDRQQVISALVANLSRISDTLGGKSPQVLEFLHDIEAPINSTLTVLDEFRKASDYGPAFMGTVNSILIGLGVQTDTDVDKTLHQAFPTVDSLWQALRLLPTVVDGIASANGGSAEPTCSKGRVQVPALGQVLITGVNGVVICRA